MEITGVLPNALWNDSDSSYVYNYDDTPKITDIAVTALTHLCVNITPPIEFDGVSWVDSCSTNTLNELDNGQINVHPNPTNNHIKSQFHGKKLNLFHLFKEWKAHVHRRD